MKEYRSLSILNHSVIKSEKDLEEICELVIKAPRFKWPLKKYGSTGSAGLYWILRRLGESAGIDADSAFCDIGFGSGEVLAAFAILGYETYGIDIREQPFEHAPDFFEKVQNKFGRFNHQPSLLKGKIGSEPAEFIFSNGLRLSEMDLYYCYINEEISALPTIIKSISPKTGAKVINPLPYYYTLELLALKKKKHPALYRNDDPPIPTYASLNFRLLNENKQRKDIFEKEFYGCMKQAYRPIFIKE